MKRNPLKEQPIPAGLGKILLAHLIPDAKNPRKDLKKGDPEFEKINKSVEKFGQLDPIIFNTRTRKILGGHQRLKVLDSQGYTELFTVALGAYTWAFAEADLKELSEKEEIAANIALNKAQGDWDIEQLTINLQELKIDDMLEFTGFDDIEFDGIINDGESIPHQEGDKAGASPWDRMNAASTEGILFQFGAITCRVDPQIYEAFIEKVPSENIPEFIFRSGVMRGMGRPLPLGRG